jgi:hypothetical protein
VGWPHNDALRLQGACLHGYRSTPSTGRGAVAARAGAPAVSSVTKTIRAVARGLRTVPRPQLPNRHACPWFTFSLWLVVATSRRPGPARGVGFRLNGSAGPERRPASVRGPGEVGISRDGPRVRLPATHLRGAGVPWIRPSCPDPGTRPTCQPTRQVDDVHLASPRELGGRPDPKRQVFLRELPARHFLPPRIEVRQQRRRAQVTHLSPPLRTTPFISRCPDRHAAAAPGRWGG